MLIFPTLLMWLCLGLSIQETVRDPPQMHLSPFMSLSRPLICTHTPQIVEDGWFTRASSEF